ncbi:MAG TPA: methyltransferase domain-containing protein [Defluviitoga tunisiensis]|nr:methyltransferase domain-containing protein [Defluviitoga tunisiensis]
MLKILEVVVLLCISVQIHRDVFFMDALEFKNKIQKIDQIYRSISLYSPSVTHFPTHASVFLLATSPFKDGYKIVELGSGIGHVCLALSKLVENSLIYGIEVQKELYLASLKNKQNNYSKNVEFYNLDVKDIKSFFSSEYADLVISNPPHYFDGIKSDKTDRRVARSADDLNVMEEFIYAAKYLLKNKRLGCFVIHPSILSDVFIILEKNNLEPQHMYIGYGNENKEAQLISLIFRKNGGRNFVIHPPIFFNNFK